jgi:hypothetical protein
MNAPTASICNKTRLSEVTKQLMGGGEILRSYIGGTPKNAPLRCNKLTTLPLGVLMGLTRRSMKNRPFEMRWKRAWVD